MIPQLCDALLLNDLTNYLETQVNYPIRLCHSTQDMLVSYENLPNVALNSQYLSLISGVTGTHQEAALYCIAQAFLYIISSDYQTFPVTTSPTLSSSGCPVRSPSSNTPPPAQQPPSLTPPSGLTSPTSSTSGTNYGVKQGHIRSGMLSTFFVLVGFALSMW
jgi:hypothetical protein